MIDVDSNQKKMFLSIKEKDSLLHYLMPPKRGIQALSKLKNVNGTFLIKANANRFNK